MSYHLIVIGAGNLGTFHAYHALTRGKKVLLLEKDAQPAEATVRNFGQVIPSGMAFDTWFEYGRESARLYRTLQQRTDLSVRANGSYYLASDDDELRLLEELSGLLRERDYACQVLTKVQCLAKIPTLNASYCTGGLWAAEDLSVEPRLMVHRVRTLLQRAFALDYRFNTAVIGCEVRNGQVEVRTASGETFRADHVAVCNGRDFNLLFPKLFAESGLKVVKLNMMETVPLTGVTLPGNILSGLSIRRYESFESCPSRHQIATPEWQRPYLEGGIHILFKQALDGSVILGDSHEYADVREAAQLDFSLRNDLNALILREAQRMMNFPTWQIQRYWAGYYGQTTDGGAFTQTIDERIHIATGIGGKGMTTGPAFARQRVESIFG
ncbi:MAG: TIGR03364 family FAD-dependent oxidoreductase [Cytophagaceae bacterium]|nr:TIGR03364 family FAD-dependent oxidoreductase [Cytophagaceae bacterium]